MMRKTFWALVVPVMLAGMLTITGCQGQPTQKPSPTPKKSAKVEIVDFSFRSDEVAVVRGGKVTWTNKDSASHTVTADNGDFDSGQLGGDAKFSHAFDKTGTFSYHCLNHPAMTATVVVQ